MLYAAVLAVASIFGQLTVAEEKFAAEVVKADAEAAKIKHAAAEARLKAYREALTAATKAGDFDKAMGLKARIEELEQEPTAQPLKRPRPKDVVRFQGHSYALVKDAVTWHVAKQRCEEMGGHLVILDDQRETAFLTELCYKANVPSAWIGATDEVTEGEWKWVDGSTARFSTTHINNANGGEHFMELNVQYGLNDGGANRNSFLCEWDR